jgi:broad specificity phosphatase PhoE
MKLYILRHEDRTQDCSFFSPLTLNGLMNANKLIDSMKDLDIKLIYTSPFIRTLQTINPYAKANNIPLNIEYGLSEIHHEDIIPKKAVGMFLPEYLAENFNYNTDYKSLINPDKIHYPERIINVRTRVKRVLRKIFEENYDKDINIILVTHQSLCSSILEIVQKKNKDISDIPIENYEKGKLSLVFDTDKWLYTAIN